MKRPLRYRTMGAVREGRGNPSPYSIICGSHGGGRHGLYSFSFTNLRTDSFQTLRYFFRDQSFAG